MAKQNKKLTTKTTRLDPASSPIRPQNEASRGRTETTETEPDKTSEEAVDKPVEEEKTIYSFPTRSRCPRCNTIETVATSTQGKVQHRRCLRAICRKTYTVIGQKI